MPADRVTYSSTLNFPSMVDTAGMQAPLFALAQSANDFTLRFTGESFEQGSRACFQSACGQSMVCVM